MANFFIHRPVVAIVVALIMMIVGAVAATRLPVAQFPDIVPPEIAVSTVYPGADAVTVEQTVATPIEQQISGVEGLLYQRSTSASDGTMTLRVSFQIGTSVNIASVLAQNRVSQALAFLPQPVQRLGITLQSARSSPMMVMALYAKNGTFDARFLSNYATININDRLLRVPGVGQVIVFGAAPYAMRIWLDPTRMAKLSITAGDVANQLQLQNVEKPAGQLGAEPAPKGDQFTYTIRTRGRLATSSEFENILLRTNPDGSQVRLKDIARVELGSQTYSQIGRFNGRPASIVAVFQDPGTNALEAAAGVRRAMAEMKPHFPPGVDYKVALDTTASVRAGIHEIIVTLFIAVALVLLVVYLFLQSWRATLIPMLTVPVSLIGALAFFPLVNFSINTLSLFGLVLAIGLVVDDAIVVVEAVQRHLEEGMSAPAAAQKAMSEVSSPVIAVALVLSAVFIPVAFAGGITGRLYQQFAVTIAASVLISAFNALSLSPALAALLLKPATPARGLRGRIFRRFNRSFEWSRRQYLRGARFLVRKVAFAIVLLGLLTGAAALLSRFVPGGFLPEEDQGFLYVNLTLPDAASLQRSEEVMRGVEAILKRTEGIADFTTVTGYSLLRGTSATFTGLGFLSLKPWDQRKGRAASVQGIMASLNRSFASVLDAQTIAFAPPALQGLGTSGGFSLFLQDTSGTLSPQELGREVDRFLAAARKRPEVASILTTFRPLVPQRYAKVDEDKAFRQGISLGELYGALSTFMGGSYINQFTRFGRTWNVYLEADARYRMNPESLGLFYVRNSRQQMVPLSTLVTLSPSAGPDFVNRFNLYRAAYITGTAGAGYSSGQVLAAIEDVARRELPSQMGYEFADLSLQEKLAPSVTGVFLLAILMVFLILAALYESWSLPFSVLLVTPVAVFGAFLGLLLRSFPFNVYAQIGVIMLVGLAAKNSILIVEYAQSERQGGRSVEESALLASEIRLRPILMTALAFILGALPLWAASGSGAEARRNTGTVVVVGMLAATLFGVFITPALFVMVERVVLRLRRRRAPAPAPSGAPATPPDRGREVPA